MKWILIKDDYDEGLNHCLKFIFKYYILEGILKNRLGIVTKPNLHRIKR